MIGEIMSDRENVLEEGRMSIERNLGERRLHAGLGIKQICIGVNRTDCDIADYKQSHVDEIENAMNIIMNNRIIINNINDHNILTIICNIGNSMMAKVGWKKDSIDKKIPVLPISGWIGNDLPQKSDHTDQ